MFRPALRLLPLVPTFLALLSVAATGGCAPTAAKPTEQLASDSHGPALEHADWRAALSAAEASEETRGLAPPVWVPVVSAFCPVPSGWVMEPLKEGKSHKHQTWISPSGRTAYGVIYATLPFPAAIVPVAYRQDKVLEGFMREMKKREGRGELIERRNDPKLEGVRFVAEGALYRIRLNLLVRGARAWFVYAGTRRGEAVDPSELRLAERARDQTEVGGR